MVGCSLSAFLEDLSRRGHYLSKQVFHHKSVWHMCKGAGRLSDYVTEDSDQVTCPVCVNLMIKYVENKLSGGIGGIAEGIPCATCSGLGWLGDEVRWENVCSVCQGRGFVRI